MRGYRLRNTGSILLALVTAATVLGSSLARTAEPAQKTVRLGFVHSQSPSTTNRGLSGFWEKLAELRREPAVTGTTVEETNQCARS